MKLLKTICASLALAFGAGCSGVNVAYAEVLVQSPAYLAQADGLQADVGAALQVANTQYSGNAVLQSIHWWGFYSVLPATAPDAAAHNVFSVWLNGNEVKGILDFKLAHTAVAANPDDFNVYEYALTIPDMPMPASIQLNVQNQDEDVVWNWQHRVASGNAGAADASEFAFSLQNSVTLHSVPEPATHALSVLGLLALLGSGIARKRSQG